jgi:hypothetical protein
MIILKMIQNLKATIISVNIFVFMIRKKLMLSGIFYIVFITSDIILERERIRYFFSTKNVLFIRQYDHLPLKSHLLEKLKIVFFNTSELIFLIHFLC